MTIRAGGVMAYVLAATMAASSVVASWPTARTLWAWLRSDPRTYALGPGYEEWAQRVLWLGCFLMLAALVGAKARWLGAAVALVGVNVLLRDRSGIDAVWVALLALGVVALAGAPETHVHVRRILAAAVVLQATDMLLQAAGVDLFRGAAQRALLPTRPDGTLGNADLAGAFVAMAAPLVAWPLLLLAIPAVVVTKSVSAMLALGLGLALRFRSWLTLVCAILAAAALAYLRGPMLVLHAQGSLRLRLSVWWAGLVDLVGSAPYVGFGLGAWAHRLPAATVFDGPYPSTWESAHSDVLQWTYELGLPGVVVLGGVLWSLRRAVFHAEHGAALAALTLLALVGFPFHAVTPGLAGALILGLSTSTTQTGA